MVALLFRSIPPRMRTRAMLACGTLSFRTYFAQVHRGTMQRLTIHQWKFGATTLRIIGLPPSARVLHGQALVDVVKPVSALAGLDKCGTFRTAKAAKEYPEGHCRALAVMLLQGLAQRRHKEGLAVRLAPQPEERDIAWLGSAATSLATSFSSHFYPDYQPTR